MDRRRFCFTLGILAPALLAVDGKALADSATPEDDAYLGSASIASINMEEGIDEMISAASGYLKDKAAKVDLTASAVDLTTAIDKTAKAARSAIEIIPTARYIYAQLSLQRAAFYALAAARGVYSALTIDNNQMLLDAMSDAGSFRAAIVSYRDALSTAIINAAKTPTATLRAAARPTRRPIRPTATVPPVAVVQSTQAPIAQSTTHLNDPTKVPLSPSQSDPAPAQPTSPPAPPPPATEAPPPPKAEPTTAPSP